MNLLHCATHTLFPLLSLNSTYLYLQKSRISFIFYSIKANWRLIRESKIVTTENEHHRQKYNVAHNRIWGKIDTNIARGTIFYLPMWNIPFVIAPRMHITLYFLLVMNFLKWNLLVVFFFLYIPQCDSYTDIRLVKFHMVVMLTVILPSIRIKVSLSLSLTCFFERKREIVIPLLLHE